MDTRVLESGVRKDMRGYEGIRVRGTRVSEFGVRGGTRVSEFGVRRYG